MKTLVFILLFLSIIVSSAFAGDVLFLSQDDLSVDLKGGYTGNYWSPKGLGPFEVDTYGRSMIFGELAVNHPLLIFGEKYDMISMPRFRVESNFGFDSEDGSIRQVLPSKFSTNPYLKTTTWLTIMEFLSVRFINEKFYAILNDPRYWNQDLFNSDTEYVREVKNSISDVEIGILGSPDGEFDQTLWEIGYYRSQMKWPLLRFQPNSTTEFSLAQEDIGLQGFYLVLNTEPFEPIWPLYSQLKVHLGEILGFDIKLQFEREANKKLRFGVDFDYSWHLMIYSDEDAERFSTPTEKLVDEDPRHTRMRVTIYTAFNLI